MITIIDTTAETCEVLNGGGETAIHEEPVNTSGIIPTEYKLLVLPDPVPETSRGFLVPASIREGRQAAATTGTVIDIAEEAFSFVEGDARTPKVGERVAFARYAGMAIFGNETPERGQQPPAYRLINDKDVVAILDFPFDPERYQF
jgi:co-chaperonin GroES (HSP10)